MSELNSSHLSGIPHKGWSYKQFYYIKGLESHKILNDKSLGIVTAKVYSTELYIFITSIEKVLVNEHIYFVYKIISNGI